MPTYSEIAVINWAPVLLGDAVDVDGEEDSKVDPLLVEQAPNHVHLRLGDTPTVYPGKHKLCHRPVEVSKDGVADGRKLGVGLKEMAAEVSGFLHALIIII